MVHQREDMTTPLWRWSDLCAALGLPLEPGPDVHRVHMDSRTTRQGDLFVALSGDPGRRFNPSARSSVDGHDYVLNAIRAGAVGALIQKPQPPNTPQLRVADTYDGLWTLGRAARERMQGARIAITGSSGKTTAKSFLQAALDAYSAPGSFNNHIGVPLSLVNMPAAAEYGVFEVGTNHPGEIEPLAQLIAPRVAVVLNIGSAHLENFKDTAALRKEKLSIFNALEYKDNAIWHEEIDIEQGVSFGRSRRAHARLLTLDGDLATYRVFGQILTARVPGGGEHRAQTLAAVMLAVTLAQGDIQAALELSADLVPDGRGNEFNVQGVTVIDDSYNANPASMQAALDAFSARKGHGGRKVAVLGEMLELGRIGPDAHHGCVANARHFDKVFYVGAGFQAAASTQGYDWCAIADERLVDEVCSVLQPGDAVLVKGSNRVFWQAQFVARLKSKLL